MVHLGFKKELMLIVTILTLSSGSTLSFDAAGTTFIAGGYSFVNGALGFVKIYTWNGSNWVQKGQTILGDNPK